jgi:hypothetical protein
MQCDEAFEELDGLERDVLRLVRHHVDAAGEVAERVAVAEVAVHGVDNAADATSGCGRVAA